MKCKIEIDCTPIEARQFFGLPDVQPLQARIMEEVEKKMLAEMDRFSPDSDPEELALDVQPDPRTDAGAPSAS